MSTSSSADIRVERWPSEIPLFVLALIASAGLWLWPGLVGGWGVR